MAEHLAVHLCCITTAKKFINKFNIEINIYLFSINKTMYQIVTKLLLLPRVLFQLSNTGLVLIPPAIS